MAGRTPTPAEAQLLGVYQDAEAAILAQITRHTGATLDAADAGRDIDTTRAAGMTSIRAAVGRVVAGLDQAARPLLDVVMRAAAEQGSAAGAAQLAAITAPGRDQYSDPVPRGALDRLAAAVLDRVTPAHAAMLRTALDSYRHVVARVVPGVLVGADTRRAATQRALWDLADRGISGFTDTTGRRWSASAYAEMAVRTAAARAHEDAKHDRLAGAGFDLVIVQGSGDRCDQCRPWSGAVLSLTGSGRRTVHVEHATRDGAFLDVEVAGSIDDARRAGFGHPQCRCSTAAYQPGITRVPPPVVDDGQYGARQRQRTVERQIRGWKAREAAALDPAAAAQARAGIRAAQARMREHLDANPDLLRRSYREKVGTGNAPTAGTRPPASRPAPPARSTDELVQHYRDTIGKIPPAERNAISDYSGGTFVSINRWLRGNDLMPPRDPTSMFASDVRPLVKALTRLANRYALPEPVRVYRRVDPHALPADLKVGATFTEEGFSSTSLSRTSSVGFRDKAVEYDIDVPKGQHAILVEGAGVPTAPGESELVLPSGTRFRVLGDETGPDGVRRVKLLAVG